MMGIACHLSYECLALKVKPDPWETWGIPSTLAGKAEEPTKVREGKTKWGKIDTELGRAMSTETSSLCRRGQKEPAGLRNLLSSVRTNCFSEEHAGGHLFV